MGRKRKQKTNNGLNNGNDFNGSFLKSDTKRSVLAVFLVSISIIAILSLFGGAGLVGNYINEKLALAFGKGRFLLACLLLVAGIMYFKRQSKWYYLFIAGGFLLFFLSTIGLFHIFYSSEKMKAVAEQGNGGGLLGFWVAQNVKKFFGFLGGLVLLSSMVIVSLLVSFNLPLKSILGIRTWFRKEKYEAEEKIDEDEQEEKDKEKVRFIERPSTSKIEKLLGKSLGQKKDSEERQKELNKKKTPVSWNPPPLELFEKTSGIAKAGDIKENAEIIKKTLKNFGIDVEVGEINVGPSVTQYSFKVAEGIKLNKITALSDDLALALASHPVRIEAPIPGKSLVGIEVRNKSVAKVRMRSLVESPEFNNRDSNLTIILGLDVAGKIILEDLGTMPHLMIAGSTGSGKSVCINSIILSLLYQNSPDDLKLILIDPKRVELSLFDGIAHLKTPVIVDLDKVANALRWAIAEMERRYKLLQEMGSRDINSYNKKILEKSRRIKVRGEEMEGEGEQEEHVKLPYIVIIIDELADIMAARGKEVEAAIIRLAQMARAVGIHLVVSTQRPSVQVITGLIKANISSRIALKVATQVDSRTILDASGAEKLIGSGDMLYVSARTPKPKRIQGVYVSESEVKRVVGYLKSRIKGELEYDEEITKPQKGGGFGLGFGSASNESLEKDDPYYERAVEEVIRSGKASASFLQRRLGIGYARAAKILDIMEENGLVGPSQGAKAREILVDRGERGSFNSNEVSYEDEIKDQEIRERWQ